MAVSSRRRAILLARLSDNREDVDLTDEGIPFGLDDQLRRMHGKADDLGWDVWKVIKNPRLSAYKRRKITLPDGRREYRVFRPDLREALADLAAGRANALLCLDLDRAFRDPKDLQDLIDVVDHSPHDIVVESVTGSLHMEKGRDNFDAEIRVLVANKASRDTARRVAAARERQALNGQYGGGKRPFGFCSGPPKIVPDGGRTDEAVCAWHGGRDCRSGITPIKTETDVIADCSRRLLQGVSLRALAAELRDKDVPTVTGAKWSAETLRDVLLRPRNAGLIVYRGEILDGVSAPWEPIVAPETFEAVRDLLTDPARQTAPGAPPRWVGTGVYRCGLCSPPGMETTRPATCHVTRGGTNPRYTCREYNHVARNAHRTDEVVFAHVMYAITHPRAYELLAPAAPDVDAAALRTEKATLRQTLARMAEDEVLGLRTQEQVRAATRRANIRISEIDELLNVTVTDDPLAEVVNAADPVKAWKDMPVADKRVIVDRLCTVTILSARPGRRFDIASVRVDPKHSLGGTPAQFQADVR
ncbi:recombinase family protein [Micromonospora solifontis]|uniref:Recombinase family protein n=1 Tax=Micromonospora solifontis TaxID=2487138 RepID=A0ABX9WBJ1_9ACTN|nr:recombinase family protein [Micromonospora solifontis]